MTAAPRRCPLRATDRPVRRRAPSAALPSMSMAWGTAFSRNGPSSGATRTARPSDPNTSIVDPGANSGEPSNRSDIGHMMLGSSTDWARGVTVHRSEASAGSSKRRQSRAPVARTAPAFTHSATAPASARAWSGSTLEGSHGSDDRSARTQASGTVRRPARRGATTAPATNRSRTSESTANASSSATRRWPATVSSSISAEMNDRSSAAGSGHHHERARPDSSIESPGTTLPASTK